MKNHSMSSSDRCFAVIPAAGRSRRMGREHKLLLPWRGATVIDHVLDAWTASSVEQVVIVVRKDDQLLQQACQRWQAVELSVPESDPEDMKRSIQLGVARIADSYQPHASDRWMVAPADLPTLRTELIDRLVAAGAGSDAILAPRFAGHRGHPVSFPWSLTGELFRLGADQGIDQILENHAVEWLDLPAEERPEDIDTPVDFQRLSDRHEPS